MGDSEKNQNERLKQQFSELKHEWDTMKRAKSSINSSITVEKALRFLGNSPRRLMLHLQHEDACPQEETLERKMKGRKLFEDSDDGLSVQESRVRSVLYDVSDGDDDTSKSVSRFFYSSSCRSSKKNEIKVGEKRRRTIVAWIAVCFIAVSVLVSIALMDGFDRCGAGRAITLVPT